MYLLIPIPPIYNIIPLSYLHSTMYLLIPAISLFRKCFGHLFTFHYVSINSLLLTHDYYEIIKFTFHYVSINSKSYNPCTLADMYLHSTMYLLILLRSKIHFCIQSHLHSTMYLLIHSPFFYVYCAVVYLHSTMYLLILLLFLLFFLEYPIYIPLCIY